MSADDDVRAQMAVQGRFVGWQVCRADRSERWVRYCRVPEGHYWAVHWRLSEPPVIAADLDELAKGIDQQDRELAARQRYSERSALNRFLPLMR